MLDRMEPSEVEGGASKEAGPSSVCGEVAMGLVGGVGGVGVTEVVGARGKEGGSSRKPGLFGDGSRAEGDRARLAWGGQRGMMSEGDVVSDDVTSRGPGLT